MARFHLNPTTGEPGPCRARVACPFGTPGEHFSSSETARSAYEALMEGKARPPLSWLLSKKGEPLSPPEDLTAFTRACFEEGQAFWDSLSPEEEKKVRFYSMGGFEYINAHLRGLSETPYGRPLEPWQIQYAQECVPVLDGVFRDQAFRPRVAYRYASAKAGTVKEVLTELLEAGTYTEPAFMSTSSSVEYPAYQVATNGEGNEFLMEIAVHKAVPLQEEEAAYRGDVQSQETELLLPRNSRFEVVGVEWRKKVMWGGLRDIMLPQRDWTDSKLERTVRTRPHATMPVVKLVQVDSEA